MASDEAMAEPVMVTVPLEWVRDLLRIVNELADEVELTADGQYPSEQRSIRPGIARRYERDTSIVRDAGGVIARTPECVRRNITEGGDG